jgi:GTP-binding protein
MMQARSTASPPSKSGTEVKLYFMAQVRADPPTFAIQVNDPKLVHFTYLRFLENRMRERYGFLGTPIRIVTKGRRE